MCEDLIARLNIATSVRFKEFVILKAKPDFNSSPFYRSFPKFKPKSVYDNFLICKGFGYKFGIYGPIGDIEAYILKKILPWLNSFKQLNILEALDIPYRYIRHKHNGYFKSVESAINLALFDLLINEKPQVFLKKRDKCRSYLSILNPNLSSEEILAIIDFWDIKTSIVKIGAPELASHDSLLRFSRKIGKLVQQLPLSCNIAVDFKSKLTNVEQINRFADTVNLNRISWFEEPFSPFDFNSYKKITRFNEFHTSISGGEHCYSFNDAINLLNTKSIDIIQPEVAWCGGVHEFIKIVGYAKEKNVLVYPHGASLIPLVKLALLFSDIDIPYIEFNGLTEPMKQLVTKVDLRPIDGYISDSSGLDVYKLSL